ncbi:MAG TPA: gas vesicle protein GvpO [Thermoleophilaceae bacterium]|nr:gas vesicle protein GvpO [Thermoleophilaceae bacterium]
MAKKDQDREYEDEQHDEQEERPRGRSNNSLTGRQAVREAREQLFELIGRPVEQVLAMERSDDGEWQVLVQVVELERIPNSTDVLGAYRVNLDGDGEVVGYRRVRRYVRSQADED